MAFIPRLTAPTAFGTYYTERRIPVQEDGNVTGWQYFYSGDYTYTNYGAHTGNCTWYAMGRSAEIAGRNLYSEFRGSYEAKDWGSIWINNNAQTSGTINYKLGDILIYSSGSSDPHGHVEVVEEINGNILTISYSTYSSTNPQSLYGMFFNTRRRPKMSFGDPASDTGYSDSAYYRNNGNSYFNTSQKLIGVIHNPYADQTPEPQPVDTELSIYISPSHYDRIMSDEEDYLDFTFDITISGIPAGDTVSGGNTWDSGLSRVYNSGWSYTDYYVGGTTYRRANKQQTLRYTREHNYAYGTTKRMYFNLTKSTGTINKTTYMLISVEARRNLAALIKAIQNKRRKRGIINVKLFK